MTDVKCQISNKLRNENKFIEFLYLPKFTVITVTLNNSFQLIFLAQIDTSDIAFT